MSLRVLFLTHRLPYAPNRGDRIRAFHLLRLLTSRHQVHLVSLVHDAEEAAHVPDLRGMVASIDAAPVARATRFFAAPLALLGQTPLTHVLLHSRQMRALLSARVRESRPQVVVAFCTGVARYAVQAPLAEVPFVLDMVDVDSEKWAALGRTTTGPKGWIFRREAERLRSFERQAMRLASATVVSSERERRLLADAVPGSEAITIPNGIDTAFFAPPGPPATEPRVVFCGVFNYQPNEDGAVWFVREVWPLVREQEPRAHLTLVGMHPSRAVRSLAEDDSVSVTGAVADVRPYLWRSAVSVAPLHLARGIQNKVLEAIAAGLPCVVTPEVFEGLPDAARAACTASKDPRMCANAVLRYLEMGGASRRAIAGRADLRAITWETQLSPFLHLVDRAGERAA